MKRIILAIIVAAVGSLFIFCNSASAQGTAFTYQGRLNAGGAPASGSYDLEFSIYDAPSGPNLIAGPLTNSAVAVTNGLFTVALDFGAGVFTGPGRWLEIAVRTNGNGGFTNLSARQALTAAPYAVTAGTVTGILPNGGLSGTYGGTVTFNNSGNNFYGNGAGLTGLDATQLTGSVPTASLGNAWVLAGNSGTTPGVNFLGTSDNQALELKVNGTRALRFEPNTNGSPNVIGGARVNLVAAGMVGSTIAGGGANNYVSFPWTNSIASNFGFIGGGLANEIDGNSDECTVGAGFSNIIQTNAYAATISGGNNNKVQAGAQFAAIGGGNANVVTTNSIYGTISGGNGNIAGYYGTVPGGYHNSATGQFSFAAGRQAQALHSGAFVWSDGAGTFSSTAANQFLIQSGFVGINRTNVINGTDFLTLSCPVSSQAAGMAVETTGINSRPSYMYAVANQVLASTGVDSADTNKWKLNVANVDRITVMQNGNVGIGTSTPANPLQMASGAFCSAAGVWTSVSDRQVKEDFRAISPQAVLATVAALPITQWKYKVEPAGVKHVGPVAQDFYSAFGLGESDKAIGAVDESGVALAAIQGLNENLEARSQKAEAGIHKSEARIQALEAENANLQVQVADLRSQLEGLQKAVAQLGAKSADPLALNVQLQEVK